MELYSSRWANRALAHLDMVPVGISRGVPRWPLPYSYRMLRLLAPSREAFALQDLAEFEQAYLAGLEKIGVERIVGELKKVSEQEGGKTLVLLCWEQVLPPKNDACHRRMLSDWLEQDTGITVPELETYVQERLW